MTHPLSKFLAVALTIALFVVGGQPAAGKIFSGYAHYLAHLVAYGAIAFAYARGFAHWPLVAVALLVATIGCVHEAYEISAHDHAFEARDAMVNALGAIFGALVERASTMLRRDER